MRRSPGAAPVGASDRKVSLPIGRCDGGARGTRGRASYVASSTRTRSLRGLDAVSVAPRHRFARADAAFLLRRSPAAPLDGSLFRRWSSLSLRPAALAVLFSPSSLSLSLSLSHPRATLPVAAARLASLVHRLSPLEPRVGAGTAANTRYRRSAASRTSLLPFERTVAAASLSVATRSSRGADRGRFVVSLHRSSQRARPRIIARTRFSLPVSTERERKSHRDRARGCRVLLRRLFSVLSGVYSVRLDRKYKVRETGAWNRNVAAYSSCHRDLPAVTSTICQPKYKGQPRATVHRR